MSSDESEKYGAILVDTSIFMNYGLKLETGLLEKLRQFKDSKIIYLLPDVIKGEVKRYLEEKVEEVKKSLENSLGDARTHLFFGGSDNDIESVMCRNEIEGIAEIRIDKFIENSGALVLDCGNYVSVSDLLQRYFKNEPPFARTGKKKNEFPDAIVLLATEAWAKEEDIRVLAVSTDSDWKSSCENSDYVDCTDNLLDALSKFNKATAPYVFLSRLEKELQKNNNEAVGFIEKIRNGVKDYVEGFMLEDVDANSTYYWELEEYEIELRCSEPFNKNFRVVDHAKDHFVLGISTDIDVVGEFSLYRYDSEDRAHIYVGNTTADELFTLEILVTVYGDLEGPLSDLDVKDIEVVDPITFVDFGTLELDCY